MFRMVCLTMNAFLRHLQRVRSWRGQSVAQSRCGLMRALSGTLLVPHRSTSSQPCDDFNQVLLRLVSMLELVLLRLVPSTHFGKQLHRTELIWEFDLAALRVAGLRQSVINGHFSNGRFQNLH